MTEHWYAHYVSGVKLPHLGQLEGEPALQILEVGASLTNGDWADHDPQLVEDARGSEVGGEVGAARQLLVAVNRSAFVLGYRKQNGQPSVIA